MSLEEGRGEAAAPSRAGPGVGVLQRGWLLRAPSFLPSPAAGVSEWHAGPGCPQRRSRCRDVCGTRLLRSPVCQCVSEAKYGAVGCLCNSSRIRLHAQGREGGGEGRGGRRRRWRQGNTLAGGQREPHITAYAQQSRAKPALTLCRAPPASARPALLAGLGLGMHGEGSALWVSGRNQREVRLEKTSRGHQVRPAAGCAVSPSQTIPTALIWTLQKSTPNPDSTET